MRLYVDIKEDKVGFFMELLKNLPFVKVEPSEDHVLNQPGSIKSQKKRITKVASRSSLMVEMKEAVEELKLVLDGKKQVRNAEDFLNEL